MNNGQAGRSADDAQLGRLMDCLESDGGEAGWTNDDYAAVCLRVLERPLDGFAAIEQSDGRLVRDLFGALGGSMAELRTVKDAVRGEMDTNQLMNRVGRAVYFALIAQSLSRYGDPISRLSDDKIISGLRWCRRLRWLAPCLRDAVDRGWQTIHERRDSVDADTD